MASKANLDVERILAMDTEEFQKLNTQQLRQATQILASAANKRIVRMTEAGHESPALANLREAGSDRITTKGKDFNALRTEFVRARHFLNAETSTLRGWVKVLNQTKNTLYSKHGIEVDVNTLGTTLRAYSELKKLDPSVKSKLLRYSAIEAIDNMIASSDEELSPGEIAQIMQSKVTALYEQKQETMRYAGVSGFYDVENDL